MIAKNIYAGAKIIKRAIELDGQHAYGLKEDWTLPRLTAAWRPPDYEDEALRITDGVPVFFAFAVDRKKCDGATWAPETAGQLKAFIGSIAHDRVYDRLELLAEAWGWSVRCVRRWADYLFARILLAEANFLESRWERFKARGYARLYLTGVRVFGGVAHKVMPALCIGTAMCLLSGCKGCAIPEMWEDSGESYQSPHWAYSNVVTGATAEGSANE
jgi:hypothetical protein